MKSFVVYLLSLYATSILLEGLYFDTIGSFLIAGIVLSIFNAVIRPVMLLFTLPVNVLTLGLFTFVVSGTMIKLTSLVVDGMSISGFWTAVLAALIISVINSVLSWLVGLND
jgi:hypothetical protein